MNFTELQKFVQKWQNTGCGEQMMAYLFGYYSEDPNYPEGVRCNIEAIYEPPQVGGP
jgi:nuclear protein localization protein 4 homolog